MAVPKKKVSKSRGAMRRANQALPRKQLGRCVQCEQAVIPHTVCIKCGFYKNAVVMPVREEQA